jgi:glyoxylase-like metal-dependent hydrolase (beta-lactamase superfamily II)
MRLTLVKWAAVAVAIAAVGNPAPTWSAQRDANAAALVQRTAAALGGLARIESLRTLKVEGYGQTAYQSGDGNLSADPNAPQKWINISGYRLAIDVQNGRARLTQRNVHDLGFAFTRNMTGEARVDRTLDGDLALNRSSDGTLTRTSEAVESALRVQVLDNPVMIVREALKPGTDVTNLRHQGELQLVDLRTAAGDIFTLAVKTSTGLPYWLGWAAPDDNVGELNLRTYWTGYQPVGGLQLPIGYNTPGDFRDIVQHKLYVDKNSVDEPLEDMAAPSEVRNQVTPPDQRVGPVDAVQIAKGIWFLHGTRNVDRNSVVFEFADHLVMFEAPISAARTRALIQKARSLVPDKPLTHLIMSHHHQDHTGGLRTAVAEGLTIIAQRENEQLIKEIAARPTKIFKDLQGSNPKPARVLPVDDHLNLKDRAMEIDLYRVVQHNHMADAVFVHVPRDKLLVQGDMFDVDWTAMWWGDNYMANVRHRNIEVERDVPVHGVILSRQEVITTIQKQIEGAEALCARAESAGLNMQACPVENQLDPRDRASIQGAVQ